MRSMGRAPFMGANVTIARMDGRGRQQAVMPETLRQGDRGPVADYWAACRYGQVMNTTADWLLKSRDPCEAQRGMRRAAGPGHDQGDGARHSRLAAKPSSFPGWLAT